MNENFSGTGTGTVKLTEEPKKKTKVAIVGCSDSKGLTPFDDPEFEIWGVNNLFPLIPRADRWFEIHHIEHKEGVFLRRGGDKFRGQSVGEYIQKLGAWAKEHNCPVYMQEKWAEVPTSVQYPLDAIVNKYGNYFTNTISYELALAISEGFREIHVYGVDMAVDTEYHHQRPSCEYFLGLAAASGIKVVIPDEADLLKTRFLYGFDEPKADAYKKKVYSVINRMNAKRANLEQDISLKQRQVDQYIGAKQGMDEMYKIWKGCE